ncbi:hypothetical protein AURDEDRAFT_113631 [Auricularia subglabra TFB-10046 SS5]|nr:hypothetical protein AURDEDRAFT_113631 [Auricularia subglabra TFB-10046 SS5]
MPDQIACVACHKAKAKCRRPPTVPIGHPCTRCEAYDMQCVARVSLRQKRRVPEVDAAAAPPPAASCSRCSQFDELKAQNQDLMGRMEALQARVAELERENEALKTVLAPPDDGLDLPVTPLLMGNAGKAGGGGGHSARSPASPPHSSARQGRPRSRYVI